MDGKLWVRIIKHNKIIKDVVRDCFDDGWQDTLREACHYFDLSFPVILPHHLRDWEQFRQTRFSPGDFLDATHFDRMEIEYFEEGAPKRKSDDPRNG